MLMMILLLKPLLFHEVEDFLGQWTTLADRSLARLTFL